MTKCNTDQLIDLEVMRYLTARQKALISDQNDFEAMQAQNGTEEQSIVFTFDEIKRMIAETQARRNELALMVTCLERTETDKRQKDLDNFEASLNQ